MALERFIPKSPDMFIRNSQDFEVAKFGHLNTIVEYINNNSAKPAGLNGYVQFNNNNALGADADLFWDNTNKYLGIGNTTPAYQLSLSKQLYTQKGAYLAIDGGTTSGVGNYVGIGTTSPTAILHLVYTYGQVVRNQRVGDALNGAPTYENFKSGGVPSALTAVLANTNLGQYTWRGSTSATTSGLGARLQTWSLENFTTSAWGSRLDISVTSLGTTSEVVMMNLRGTGVNIGNGTADLGARLGVKGSGSTSATTALLVQNSSSTAALTVKDDLTTTFNGSLTTAPATNNRTWSQPDANVGLYLWSRANAGTYVGTNTGFYHQISSGNAFSLNNNTNNILIGSSSPSASVVDSVGLLSTTISQNSAVAIGANTGVANFAGVAIGVNATTTGGNTNYGGIALGANAKANNYGFAMGYTVANDGEFVAAGAISFNQIKPITNVYFGSGRILDDPSGTIRTGVGVSYAINGSGANGTDFAGGNLTLAGGKGTGTGTAGNVIFSTSTATTSGTTLQTLSERMRIDGSGNVGIGLIAPTARLQVQGSGSTSGTTAFLVQNSSGTTGFRVDDNSTVTVKSNISAIDSTIAFRAATSLALTLTASQTTIGNHTAFTNGALDDLVNGNYFFRHSTSGNSFDFRDPTRVFLTTKNSGTLIQNTSFGGTAIADSALLEVQSTTKGFLPPRMTTAQRVAISSPTNGLIVFDTDVQNLCYRRDGVWVQATYAAV